MNNINKYIYNIGGRIIKITGPCFKENRFLGEFRCDEAPADEEFEIEFRQSIAPPESQELFSDGYLTVYADGTRTMKDEVGGGILFKDTLSDGKHNVEFLGERSEAFGNMMILHIIDLPGMFTYYNGLILHASFIEYNGEAILFTADKQVGKSTQAALWEKNRGAYVVNGDRALIKKNGDGFYAFGLPYCGTSEICHNECFPIKAIVILSQAPDNSVRRGTVHDAVSALLSGATYNLSDVSQVNRVLDTAEEIIKTIPVFCLECTADVRAVETLEAVL